MPTYSFQLNVQAVCDHNGLFTDYDLGWPGCMQDSTVFRLSEVWIELAMRFARDEYILVDKGYLCFIVINIY